MKLIIRLYVNEHVNLNCKVIAAEKTQHGWQVSIKKKNWSNGHYFHPEQQIEEEEFTREYSHLIVCSGLHNVPYIPKVDLENFNGTLIHSNDYRDAERFKNQDVVVVGSGESASDIALQISKTAKSCTIAQRSAPGTLFPRFIQGSTADTRDDRLTYNLPRIWRSFILRGHRRYYQIQKENKAVFHWAARSNFENNRCAFNTNACKSFGIPESIVHYKAKLKPEIAYTAKDDVFFKDGSQVKSDAIIFCTGYKLKFSFFSDQLSDQLIPINNLWKNCIHPDLDSLFLVGFSRPQQINLVTIAEMQARMVALVISQKKTLPSKETLLNEINKDQSWMRKFYGNRYEKNPALVDFLYYMDSMAEFIGCQVPLKKAFIKDFALWRKLVFSSLNGAQYRLVGPGSNWHESAQVIKGIPTFLNRKNALLRWSVLSVLTMISSFLGLFNKDYRSVKKQAGMDSLGRA